MQNQIKVNSANFCGLAGFSLKKKHKTTASIVHQARERRPREERQIHSKRKIGQHVRFYVLFKTQKQWTRDLCNFIARTNDRNLDEQH